MKMATHSFGYDIEVVSQYYAKYRPTYPPKLYEKILQLLDDGSDGRGRRGLAVDVGCGCGQSTLPLARHFETVIGIDTSETQLTEAQKLSVDYCNVLYKRMSAEDLSTVVATESTDLVTVGTAVHWFDIGRFYKEVSRILKPGGALAVYTYALPQLNNRDADDLVNTFLRGTMKNYWQAGAEEVFNGYKQPRALLPQFFDQCIRDDSISRSFNYDLREMLGFIKSFPQYIYFKTDHPGYPDELDLITERLMNIFGSNSLEEKILQGSRTVHLLFGRRR